MELKLKRIAFKENYTIGKLYVDGRYFCDTIEDKNRDINKNGKFDNGEVKVPAKTCIPFGRYEVTISVVSPKFSQKTYKNGWYLKNANGGQVPRLLKVPSFEGILMHCGSTENSSAGCIIVGKNTIVGRVTDSENTFVALYKIFSQARGKIFIEVE
ncbi:MAG: DUF5675 family protein [Prevotellaceae bacterium]|jgi:hypothetical protein|nr:DUF5675 family protein [Prevotellaceae bacterium]